MVEKNIPEDIIVRHGDKGTWKIDSRELENDTRLSKEEAQLIMTVLQEEFPDMKETPLVEDGLIRSLRLGDTLFEDIVDRIQAESKDKEAVMLVLDSGKDRPRLTSALVTNRISQLETIYNKDKDSDQIKIHMIHPESTELADMLADSHSQPWEPYGKKVSENILSEDEAIAQWLKDLNQPNTGIDEEKLPKESAVRYRSVITKLRRMVTTHKVPLYILGVGHSGPLGQIKYEKQDGKIVADDVPEFCEMYEFDKEGNLLETEKIEI